MQEPTANETKDMQDEIARVLAATLDCSVRGDWYVDSLDDRPLAVGHEPGTGTNKSNSFELVLDGFSDDGDYQDVFEVVVVHRRRLANGD